MGHRDLRLGRASCSGQAFTITTVTSDRRPIFLQFALARIVIAEMRRLDQAAALRSLAWVVMPDHVHWLLFLGTARLSDVMREFKGRTAYSLNRSLGRCGRLWQPAYYDHAIRDEAELLPAARYIVANPLRAGLVTSLGDYPHWDAIWL